MSPTSYQAALPRSLEFPSVVHSLVRVNDVVDLKCFREVNKAPKAQLFQTCAASLVYVRPLMAYRPTNIRQSISLRTKK